MIGNRTKWYLVSTACALLAACSWPSDLCGCGFIRSGVLVKGVVLDRNGAPGRDARIAIDAVPRNTTVYDTVPVEPSTDRTDAFGRYRAIAFSNISAADTQNLRIAVMVDPNKRLLPMSVTLARFRKDGKLDSVVRNFSVP